MLEAKNQARELALTNSRATIRHCAHSIRASHRGEADNARELLASARDIVTSTKQALAAILPRYLLGGLRAGRTERILGGHASCSP